MTHLPELSLDLSLLERRRQRGDRIIARCPACAEGGGDTKAEHLVIFSSGKFACAAMPQDREHRRRIFALVGIRPEIERDPREVLAMRDQRALERQRERDRKKLAGHAADRLRVILDSCRWEPEDVWDSSPQILDDDLVIHDPRHFLACLYPAEALLWTGEVWESGQGHAGRWRSCAAWRAAGEHEPGPMVAPGIWKPGTHSRTMDGVLESPYTVLDFDGFGGVKPLTLKQRQKHFLDSLAMIRWVRESLRWQLAAILHTGGKSLHAWFRTPSPKVLESLRTSAAALGIDAGLIGRPEHPCRLPGQIHDGSGKRSRILWLDVPGKD